MSDTPIHAQKNIDNRTELTHLVEKLTTSGQPSLDVKVVKALKQICRQSDDYVRQVFHMLMTCLNKQHAEIRLSAFQICEELFVRSHCFRDLLLSEMQNFLQLVLEIDASHPLPPPKNAARELQKQAAKALKNWYENFGQTYKKLSLGYNYLLTSKKIDFSNIHTSQFLLQQEKEQKMKQDALNKKRIARTLEEVNDVSADINACLTEAESCITLLLQSVGLFDIDDLHSSEPFVNSAEKIAVITAPVETCEAVKQYSAITCSSPRQIYSDTTSDEACHTVSFKTSLSSGNSNSTEDQPDLAGGVLSGSSGIEHNGESSVNVLSSAESSKYPADYLFTSSTDDNIRKEEVRHHGLLAFGPSMHISVSREIGIQETDDNVELIQNLHDQWSLLTNRYLPAVKKWLDILAKAGASQDNVKMVLDLKSAIQSTAERIQKLKMFKCNDHKASMSQDDSDSSDDEGFEEVPIKEGYEEHVPPHLLKDALTDHPPRATVRSYTPWHVKDREHDIEDPTAHSSSVRGKHQERRTASNEMPADGSSDHCVPSTSGLCNKQNDMRSRAPVVAFGSDLCTWEEKVDAPLIARNNPDTNWWSKASDDAIDVVAIHAGKSRIIEFSGSFKPVKWKCRAPLANGLLCERMDRHKCPFHGTIVPRDDKGNIQKGVQKERKFSETSARTESVEDNSRHDSWNDPELLADIEAATGINLSKKVRGTNKGKQPQRKQKNGLTDIRVKPDNNARKRLEAKVLNRTALKRVAQAMDDQDSKMFAKKFANSFKNTFST